MGIKRPQNVFVQSIAQYRIILCLQIMNMKRMLFQKRRKSTNRYKLNFKSLSQPDAYRHWLKSIYRYWRLFSQNQTRIRHQTHKILCYRIIYFLTNFYCFFVIFSKNNSRYTIVENCKNERVFYKIFLAVNFKYFILSFVTYKRNLCSTSQACPR